MKEGGQGSVSIWNIVSAWLACTAVVCVAGDALRRSPPSLWAAAMLLLGWLSAIGWFVARVTPERPKPNQSVRSAEAWDTGLRLWSWGNYPFLIMFVCGILALGEFERIYGFGRTMLVGAVGMAPLLGLVSSIRRRRERALPGGLVELPGGEPADDLGEDAQPGE